MVEQSNINHNIPYHSTNIIDTYVYVIGMTYKGNKQNIHYTLKGTTYPTTTSLTENNRGKFDSQQ